MENASHTASAVSAPGKVLLAGGYLVLDREYNGLVFGLDARIHVHINPLKTASGVHLEEIVVRSPQFVDAIWEYGYRKTESDGGMQVTQLRVSAQDKVRRNPFVETALSYALTYIAAVASPVIEPANITILADDSYYTTKPALSGAAITEKTFSHFGVRISEAHKTGLGSSAALVTALTGALLIHYLPKEVFSLDRDSDRRKLHNLAQMSHCAAQGKIGSGFDVASAVFGSCLYRRFSPSLLKGLEAVGTPGFRTKVRDLVNESTDSTRWDTEIQKSAVKVPKGIRLVMCDVDCGSQTPGMVKQVLAWRQQEPDEAEMLWGQLQKKNQALAEELTRLTNTVSNEYSRLSKVITEIRRYIQDMSRLSGVPIEPPPQTQLIDTCTEIEGVIGGVVPGAGGYDAIAVLIKDDLDVLQRLDKTLSDWKVETYSQPGAGPSIGKVSRLPVREEMDGIRLENVSRYDKWLQ